MKNEKILLITIVLIGVSSFLSASSILKEYEEECESGNLNSCKEILVESNFSAYSRFRSYISIYKNSCENGHNYSCYALAEMYAIKQDEPYASILLETTGGEVEYFHKKACSGGLNESCNWIGDKYGRGLKNKYGGTSFDYGKAEKFYTKSCEAGSFKGCNGLAYSLSRHEPKKAIELYNKFCDAGNGESCFKLAEMYFNGWNFKKSWEKAKEFYKKSSDNGYWEAKAKYNEINNWGFLDKASYNMSK